MKTLALCLLLLVPALTLAATPVASAETLCEGVPGTLELCDDGMVDNCFWLQGSLAPSDTRTCVEGN
jgi:hypothetical protein